MDEHALRELIAEVTATRLSRRRFVQTMIGLGLTAPVAAQMLAVAGPVQAQPKSLDFTPTRRGGGGLLKALWWQAPTLLNPHFATGTKDQDASRIFYEPLAGFDPDGNVIPILAAEAPSVANGTLAKDLTWVTWRLKRGVTWHDGKPFTAEDVVFNWEFVVAVLHEPVHLVGGGVQGEQVAGAEHHPLAKRGVRPDLHGGRHRAGPGEASGALHQDERPGHPARGGHPRAVALQRLRFGHEAQGHGPDGLGLDRLASAILVQAGMSTARREVRDLDTLQAQDYKEPTDGLSTTPLTPTHPAPRPRPAGLPPATAASADMTVRSASRRTAWGWGPTVRGERSGSASRRTAWGWGPTVRGERSDSASRRTAWGWGPTVRGERSRDPQEDPDGRA
ncbi:MAG: hypothetical protein DMF80_23795 [Acidobacteria bacterium]|nr:MAG: hypothetical protein DMF80_23795 [Acidobacteriota bacterium]